jgi:hypothetical protein
MKRSREILLSRHESAAPKLDTIRREIVAGLNRQDTKAHNWQASLATWWLGGFRKLWRELYLPSRRIWSGLATVWVLILIVNFSQRDHTADISGGRVCSAGPMMSSPAQQRWMNELLADRSTPTEAERPRNLEPKPRTQKTENAAV